MTEYDVFVFSFALFVPGEEDVIGPIAPAVYQAGPLDAVHLHQMWEAIE